MDADSPLLRRGRAALPQQLGPYTLLKKIAVGGMAEIFLARQGSSHQPVVIKRILPNLAAEREFMQMFLDEAKIAASLVHPNIVQVVDAGQAGGDLYIAMEYLHGEDLRKLMLEPQIVSRGFPLDAAIGIVLGATAGLHHAHGAVGSDGTSLELVHRDVTPQNVFVTFDGGVKLMDFGIAKAENRLHATKSGMLKGKVQYMSPEQGRSGPLDRRSDLYSVGIVLYELTTGYRLYKGGSEFEILKKIVEGTVPPPSRLVPDYPLELERVVMKALQKDPARRHQTAEELGAELATVAADLQLDAGPDAARRLMSQLYAERIASLARTRASGRDDLEILLDDAGSAEYTLPPELRAQSFPDAGAGEDSSERELPEREDTPEPAMIDGLLDELDDSGKGIPPMGRPLAEALRGAAADAAPRGVLPSPRGSRLPAPTSSPDSTPIPPRLVTSGDLDSLLADLESSKADLVAVGRPETFSDLVTLPPPEERTAAGDDDPFEESFTAVTRPVLAIRNRAPTSEVSELDIEATEPAASPPTEPPEAVAPTARPVPAKAALAAPSAPSAPSAKAALPAPSAKAALPAPSAKAALPAPSAKATPPKAVLPAPSVQGAPPAPVAPPAPAPAPPAPAPAPPAPQAGLLQLPKAPMAAGPAAAVTFLAAPPVAQATPRSTPKAAPTSSPPAPGPTPTPAAPAPAASSQNATTSPLRISPSRAAVATPTSLDPEPPTYEKLLTPLPTSALTPTERVRAPRSVSLHEPLALVVPKGGLGALWGVAVVLALGALGAVLELKTDVFHPARRRAKIEAAVRAEDEANRAVEAARRAVGDVVVESDPPGAAVWLRLGRTPLDTRPLDVAMTHELRLEHEGYQIQDVALTPSLWAGEADARRASVTAALAPAPAGYAAPAHPTAPTTMPAPGPPGRGVLHVESTPPGAIVWLLVGFSGDTRITSHPTDRDVELKLTKDGFVPGFVLVRSDDWRDPGGPEGPNGTRSQIVQQVKLTPLAPPPAGAPPKDIRNPKDGRPVRPPRR